MMKLVWCNLLLVFLICMLSEDCFCGNLDDDEKPLIFTVASEQTDGYLRFQRSAKIYNIDVTTLGMNKPWKGGDMNFPGGGYKVNLLKEALKPYKKDTNRIVLFSDSYDVIFLTQWSTIVEKFKKSGARVLFGAESFCWPEAGLKQEYPPVEGNGYKYLNSGMFIGYAANIYDILMSSPLKDNHDDQLFYSKVFLNPEMREKNGIKLDNKADLFQNLHGLTGDVSLELIGGGLTVLLNKKFNSHPALVHGNGPSKLNLNNYGNYLAEAFSEGSCRTCLEQNIPDKDLDGFTILIAFFIEQPTPFLRESLRKIEMLNYSKNKLHIFIHNNIAYHKPEVEMFLETLQNEDYISVKVLHEEDGISEATARELAVNRALNKQCDYLFVVDADVHLDNPDALRELIMFNRTILAPIVTRDKSVWSNFWGAVSDKGFYARSADYMTIVNNEIRGIWNVPFISGTYLIKSSVLQKISYTRAEMDPDMAFCEHLRSQNIFMEACNLNLYGHLVNPENFDVKRTRPDFYELFANQKDWEERFLDPEYFDSVEVSYVPKQPCTDVYWFPLGTPEFCESMIDIMEAFGKWSDGTNSDQRLQGGYEAVPTRDIHMNQVGLEQMWLKLLQLYVKPLQEKVFIGYFHDPPRSLMNFVVRYRPDEQPFLRPHHDSSTYTINIALNRVGVDYEGGGCNFLRYNCSIEATKRGWMLLHPGRLTHFHEGLLVTKGTRYIMISFIDP